MLLVGCSKNNEPSSDNALIESLIPEPEYDYLSESMNETMIKYNTINHSEALQFRNEGISLHNKKDYENARKRFIKSLSKGISADTYYYYGNTLLSLKEYSDAHEAYYFAEYYNIKNINDSFVKFKDQKIIGVLKYNMACASSRRGDIDYAFDDLRESIQNGYAKIDYMAQDPDLENVRKSNRWNEFYSTLKNQNNEKITNIINKVISQIEPSSQEDYFFYDNNLVKYKSYCDPKTVLRGQWKIIDSAVLMTFTERYQKIGKGEIIGGCSACNCEYNSYSELYSKMKIDKKIDLRNIILDPNWWKIKDQAEPYEYN